LLRALADHAEAGAAQASTRIKARRHLVMRQSASVTRLQM
jgi:hypothetical protein